MSSMIGENPAADIRWLERVQQQRPLSTEEASLLVNLYLLIEELDHARALNEHFSRIYSDSLEFDYLRIRMALLDDPANALAEASRCVQTGHLPLSRHVELLDLEGLHSESLRLLSDRMCEPLSTSEAVALFNRMAFSALNSPTLDHVEWRPRFEACVNRHYPENPAFRTSLPSGTGRLRIGFLGSTFHYHPMANFIAPIFRGLRKVGAEFAVFSNGNVRDVYQQRLRELAPEWHDVSSMDDASLHAFLCRQELAVLIDLDNHTRRNRLVVFAARAAPVQASLYGLNLTTGVKAMDYRICDAATDPPSVAGQFSENLLRLPESHLAYDALTEVPKRTARHGRVRVGVFNHWHKIGQSQIDLFAQALRELPELQLVLVGFDDGVARHALIRRLRQHLADLDRVEMHSFVEQASFFRLAQSVDFALDSWPWGGGATTAALLNLGVPVLCWRGQRPASRIGPALLDALQRPDWFVDTVQDLLPAMISKVRGIQTVRVEGPGLQADFQRAFGAATASGQRLWEALAALH